MIRKENVIHFFKPSLNRIILTIIAFWDYGKFGDTIQCSMDYANTLRKRTRLLLQALGAATFDYCLRTLVKNNGVECSATGDFTNENVSQIWVKFAATRDLSRKEVCQAREEQEFNKKNK